MRATILGLIVCLTAGGAQAYELKRDSTGEIVRWLGPARFVVDDHAAELLHEVNAFSAIQAAVDTLARATPNLSITVESGRTSGVGFDQAPDARNQNDIVVLKDWPYAESAIAVTVLTLNAAVHEIVDADIALNARNRSFRVLPPTSVEGGPFDDVQNTMTHELGHAVGLAHNPSRRDAVMYPGARRGEVNKRVLSDDDEQGLIALYKELPTPALASNVAGAGCGATGATNGAWALILAALAFLATRAQRGRATCWAALATLALGSVSADASEAEENPLERAELVATADVVAARALPPEPGARLLYTELEVRVRECVRGACVGTLRIKVPGGRSGDIEQEIEDHPVPRPGEVIAVAREAVHTRIYRLADAPELVGFARALAAAGLHADLSFALPRPPPTSVTPER